MLIAARILQFRFVTKIQNSALTFKNDQNSLVHCGENDCCVVKRCEGTDHCKERLNIGNGMSMVNSAQHKLAKFLNYQLEPVLKYYSAYI